MTDSTNLMRLMQDIQPTEIYNLTAQSHVGVSLRARNIPPMSTRSACCDYWKRSALSAWKKETRFYQASTSELYGLVQEVPQGAYAVLSALAYAVVKLYGYLFPKLPTISLLPCIS